MDITRRTRALSDADAEALLAGRAVPGHPELHDALTLVRQAAAAPVPAPSAALAAVLRDGLPPVVPVPAAPSVAPGRRWAARAALTAAAVLASTLGAASANALPAPVQTAVADVVDRLTDLQLPRPEQDEDDAPTPDRAPLPGTDEDDVRKPVDPVDPDVPPSDDEPSDDGPSDEDTPDGRDTDADEVDTDEPDTDEPDTDEPATDEPATDEPATDEIDTED